MEQQSGCDGEEVSIYILLVSLDDISNPTHCERFGAPPTFGIRVLDRDDDHNHERACEDHANHIELLEVLENRNFRMLRRSKWFCRLEYEDDTGSRYRRAWQVDPEAPSP